jgi:outer membrane protein assembly factor BamB
MLKIEDGNLIIRDGNNEKIFKPRLNRILQADQIGSLYLIREEPIQSGMSCLYAIDKNLNVIWEVSPPYSQDYFSNEFFRKEGKIIIYTWNGLKCSIDELSGKIQFEGHGK